MEFSIRISGDAGKKIDRVQRSFPSSVQGAVKKATVFMWARVHEKTPVGHGYLKKSILYKVSNLEGVIRPTVKYAIFVHEGTRPHWVPKSEWALPTGSLYKWAKKKGLNPYLVARSIARKGTKKQPWMRKTFDTYESQVRKFFDESVDRLIKEA